MNEQFSHLEDIFSIMVAPEIISGGSLIDENSRKGLRGSRLKTQLAPFISVPIASKRANANAETIQIEISNWNVLFEKIVDGVG